VYGKSGVFDAERLIDLLQALEKFVAVKDKGDGAAFKVDGLRGGMDLGTGGDFVGTKAVSGAGVTPASVATAASTNGGVPAPSSPQQKGPSSSAAARDALRFLFSDEGDFFREFILDEVRRLLFQKEGCWREGNEHLCSR
jgi:aarF domain-containing kinase